MIEEYHREYEVEWRGIDSAVVAAAFTGWFGLFWMGYRLWKMFR